MPDWLSEALRAHFGEYVEPLWVSTGFWRGVTLVLLALVAGALILLVRQRHRLSAFLRRDERRQHDRALFGEADGLLPEGALRDTLRTLSGDHSYSSDQRQAIAAFRYYFEETGHHFLDQDIGEATVRLVRSLGDLSLFVGQYFRVYGLQPDRHSRLCMLPTLNPDRDGEDVDAEGHARYEKCADELDGLVNAVLESYQNYRKLVKARLTV